MRGAAGPGLPWGRFGGRFQKGWMSNLTPTGFEGYEHFCIALEIQLTVGPGRREEGARSATGHPRNLGAPGLPLPLDNQAGGICVVLRKGFAVMHWPGLGLQPA